MEEKIKPASEAVVKFVEEAGRMTNGPGSVISLVMFDHEAKTTLRESALIRGDVERAIQYTGGGTNFTEPLVAALQLVKETKDEYHKHFILLYTDGDEEFPGEAAQEVQSFRAEYSKKLEFFAISEDSYTTMRKVCSTLYDQAEVGDHCVENIQPQPIAKVADDGSLEACSPEPARPLTATVSDRPTPSRGNTPKKTPKQRRTRSSLASAITATQPDVVSPVATEIDSDAESAVRSRSQSRKGPEASKIDVEGVEITDAIELKRHEPAKPVAQHAEEPLARARRTRNLPTASEDDLLAMLQVPAPSTGTDAATAATPNPPAACDDRAEAAAAAARFAAEASAQAPPEAEEEDCTWVTGGVVRPLERLMFGESPRRLSRGSRILGALLDTPPDVEESPSAASKARPSKKAKRDAAALAPAASAKAVSNQRPDDASGRPISVNDMRRAMESTWQKQGRSGRAQIERRAIWFLEQPGPHGCDTELSRVAVEEEAFLDSALEAALDGLRKKGVSRGGPAA
ncbi:unnamed protein product, partial [Symbiodinium sp. CCMP2456]